MTPNISIKNIVNQLKQAVRDNPGDDVMDLVYNTEVFDLVHDLASRRIGRKFDIYNESGDPAHTAKEQEVVREVMDAYTKDTKANDT